MPGPKTRPYDNELLDTAPGTPASILTPRTVTNIFGQFGFGRHGPEVHTPTTLRKKSRPQCLRDRYVRAGLASTVASATETLTLPLNFS